MVSVIIAAYNYARFIPHSLCSLAAQEYGDFECIIVDNGSDDDTAGAVSPFLADSRFRYIRRQRGGVSEARNTGLEQASGEYVLFLDADDLVQERKLGSAVAYLNEHPEATLVYGGMRYFRDEAPDRLFRSYRCDAGDDKDWMTFFSGGGTELARLLLAGNIMVISSPVVRRSALDAAGHFDERLRYNEDWELWMRLALQGGEFRYHHAGRALTLIRLHSNSLSRDVFSMQLSGTRVLLKHRAAYEKLGLSEAVSARIAEHIHAIRSTLSRSDAKTFRERLSALEAAGLREKVAGPYKTPLAIRAWLMWQNFHPRT